MNGLGGGLRECECCLFERCVRENVCFFFVFSGGKGRDGDCVCRRIKENI